MPFGARVVLALYSIAIEAVVWLALVPIGFAMALAGRRSREEITERLGWPGPSDAKRAGCVLIHAVSVGEMNSAAPLVAELAKRGQSIWLTAGTSGGFDAAARIAAREPAVKGRSYLPFDRRGIRRWLHRAEPAAVVVVETELWPCLFAACGELGVPLFIASGRIRPQDVWKYRLVRAFFRSLLKIPAWIGAQSAEDRDAFVAVGAPASRVEVAGTLKFDAALIARPSPAMPTAVESARPLLVCGSTHAPEESIVFEAARILVEGGHPIRVVVAPRDLSRCDEVMRHARRGGWVAARSSELGRNPDEMCDVLVLDRFGTLGAYYAAADIVLIGGTFTAVGGHNILEAAASARPILVGPRTDGIAAHAKLFADAGALWTLADVSADGLAEACRALIDDRPRARRMGEAGLALCRDGAGAAARQASAILATPRRGVAGSR